MAIETHYSVKAFFMPSPETMPEFGISTVLVLDDPSGWRSRDHKSDETSSEVDLRKGPRCTAPDLQLSSR
jgi:hypothetical protein